MQFEIVPFVPCPGVTKLSGNVSRTNNQLSVEFLPMVLTDILWPARDSQPKRLDNLWQSTCFECFVGTNRDASYLEINASPKAIGRHITCQIIEPIYNPVKIPTSPSA